MKKLLLASTALLGFAGVAAAEVTMNGEGRFGLVYTDDGTENDTELSYRLRLNINVKTETDAGVTFGGRVRVQYQNGDINDFDDISGDRGAAQLNAAMLYMEASGFRVEVGNVNTAFDLLNTVYNAELGFISSTTGSYALTDFDAYISGPYAPEQVERIGLFASYSAGDFVARLSYIDYDQTDAIVGAPEEDEIGVSFDYATGAFQLGFGYVANATGLTDYDIYALLGEYAVNDATSIGAQLIGEDGEENDVTFTIYGHHKLAGGVGISGFLSGVDSDVTYENDYALGIGANYDLGGAVISGTIQTGFEDDTYADLGVNFKF